MSVDKDYMLTTKDNPYDPWTEWKEWWTYDYSHGYHTPGYLARIVKTSDEFPEWMQHADIIDAIDEIIEMNPTGMYTKAYNPKRFEEGGGGVSENDPTLASPGS